MLAEAMKAMVEGDQPITQQKPPLPHKLILTTLQTAIHATNKHELALGETGTHEREQYLLKLYISQCTMNKQITKTVYL